MEENINKRLRTFGLSFAIGMLILFTIGYFKNFNKIFLIIILILSSYHFIFAIIFPKLLIVTFYPLTFIGKIIGNTLNIIIFTIVFFIFFTPISIILRIFGKDQIKNTSKNIMWQEIKEEENNPERVKRLY